ncbi:MAG: response regulator [Mariprofundaceae bacterium]|nr:response regulator [Mariprofundaceae bacterium]
MSGFDLSNFLASFFDEAKERLSSINQHLVNFESGKLGDDEFVELRRDAHTIKGSALMLGVNDIGGVGHLFEDAIEQLIEHPEWRTPAMVQFLFDLHDKLEHRLKDPDSHELLEPDTLRNSYNQIVESIRKDSGQATVAEAESEKAYAASSGLVIGADEAAEWKKGRKERVDSVIDETADLLESLPEALAGIAGVVAEEGSPFTEITDESEESFENISMMPLPEADSGGLDDFRPDVSQVEMKATGQRKSSGRFLRVDAERLEELSNHVIELSTEQSRGESVEKVMQSLHLEMRALRREWQQFRTELSTGDEKRLEASIHGLDDAIAGHVRRTRHFVDEYRHGQARSGIMLKDLRDQVLSLMLRPLDTIFSTFPRAIRDVAVRADKRVNLQIAGESVEIDQGVAETLIEPMVHLLNNAVAHGIESPEERRNAGKPEEGQITIIARQSGNEVRIEVVDDGRGIDSEIVKRTAVERGVTTQVEADAMDSAEILEMIFRPGFSTHSNVTDLAGRGIGMNVVQDALRRLTGSIRIHTMVGEGTRFILSLPVRIAVQHALLFRMGDQRFGMLTHMIEQAVPLKKQTLEKGAGGKDFIRYGNHLVPIVDLRSVMTKDQGALSDYPYVLISEHIEGFVGIVIDELLDDHEIVVRDLDPYIKRYQPQGLMGNTIAADGSILLLLEPYGIKEMGRTSPDDDLDIVIEEQERLNLHLLLVDDSLIARKVEQGILESIGFSVDTAIDGLDALAKLDSGSYDMVITDLEMPRLDGFGLVRHMRNQAKYEDIPILIISTRESAEDRMRGLEAGADAYLVKQQLDGKSLMKSINMLVGH